MGERPRFRPERAPARAPWSLVALLALVGLGLVVRGSWPESDAVPALVEVRGDVPRPGTYALDDPTVRAAVHAAGGEASGFPQTPVPAGFRVVVTGATAEIARPSDPRLVSVPIDPNTAERHELLALPGVGPATADRILADRSERGPYRDLDAMRRVLRPDALASIEPFIAIAPVPPIDLNRASAGELETLPGIGPVLSARIVVDRVDRGPYRSIDDLARVKGVRAETLDAIRPFVQVVP